mmetsp:Transcript_23348/g.45343  ORF Transcript_23348/g.45343 Transcript_23348/m.45343 type:complete len:85 (+) Transcript_23348:469-723(+)
MRTEYSSQCAQIFQLDSAVLGGRWLGITTLMTMVSAMPLLSICQLSQPLKERRPYRMYGGFKPCKLRRRKTCKRCSNIDFKLLG